MERNKLSAHEQIERQKNNTENASTLVELGNSTTQRFTRKTLDNGYTVSMATDVDGYEASKLIFAYQHDAVQIEAVA